MCDSVIAFGISFLHASLQAKKNPLSLQFGIGLAWIGCAMCRAKPTTLFLQQNLCIVVASFFFWGGLNYKLCTIVCFSFNLNSFKLYNVHDGFNTSNFAVVWQPLCYCFVIT